MAAGSASWSSDWRGLGKGNVGSFRVILNGCRFSFCLILFGLAGEGKVRSFHGAGVWAYEVALGRFPTW